MQREKIILIYLLLIIIITVNVTVITAETGKILYVDCNHLNASDNWLKDDNSITQPWATIQKAADSAEPGDTIYVRQGVYHEAIIMRNSGTWENVITFMAYPGEEVIINGSMNLSGWQKVTSAEECMGNPNWENIYYVDIPENVEATSANLYDNETLLQVSQEPDPEQPLYFNKKTDQWFSIPEEYYPEYNDGSPDRIVDPGNFNQDSADYWENAYIIVHSGNNNAYIRKINSFEPEESAINFDLINVASEYNTDMQYTLWNHLSLIDQPGEYFIDEQNNKAYLWPLSEESMNNITVSDLEYGFRVYKHNHIVIDGFVIKKQSAGYKRYGYGSGIMARPYYYNDNITVKNNEIMQLGYFSYPAIQFGGINHGIVYNNYIHDTHSKGIHGSGSSTRHIVNNVIANNLVERVGSTAISFYYAKDSSIINNTIRDNLGHHANGYTLSLYCENINVIGNKAFNCTNTLTMNSITNVNICHNLFVSYVDAYQVIVWDKHCDGMIFNQNTVVHPGQAAFTIPGYGKNIVVTNNILTGLNDDDRYDPEFTLKNNLYIYLCWNMDEDEMGENSIYVEDWNQVFKDYENGDYSPNPDGPAVDMSTTGSYVGALRP